MRIADHIAAYMIENDLSHLMWGDGHLVNAAHDHVCFKTKPKHPLNVMDAACAAMDRAPDLFIKSHIRGMDSKGRPRVVRSFKLKQPESEAE